MKAWQSSSYTSLRTCLASFTEKKRLRQAFPYSLCNETYSRTQRWGISTVATLMNDNLRGNDWLLYKSYQEELSLSFI